MGFKYLTVERQQGIERLVLNRPDVRNAFNEGMIAELTWWADSVSSDRSVREYAQRIWRIKPVL